MTSLIPSDTINYSYGNTDWKDQLTVCNGQAITYDAIGNLSYRGMTMTRQNGRQLATLSKDGLNASYIYNDAGLRLSKTVNGTTTEYYWNGTQLLAQKTGITYLYFLYDETGSAVGYKYNNKTYIYVKNLQGDVTSVIDGTTGTAVATYTYDSWGNVLTATGPMAEVNPIRYRGYYYDTETSLYYLQSRYYDAQTHRFINADTILTLTISGLNAYGYCVNSPINKRDSNGHLPVSIGVLAQLCMNYNLNNPLFGGPIGKVASPAKEAKPDQNTAMSSKNNEGNFFTDTFGAAVYQSNSIEEGVDTLVYSLKGGVSSSYVISGDNSKPIVFYAQNASEWWKIWEYKVGVNVNIGDGGFNVGFGPGETSLSVSIGNTSLEIFNGVAKSGFTYSQDVNWKNHTAGNYMQFYVRPVTCAAGVLLAAYGMPVAAPVAIPAA